MKRVLIPGLSVVVYSGEAERKFWEAKDRVTPILEKGDMVIIPNNIAALICRKNDFNITNDFYIFASEKEDKQTPSPLALTEDEKKLIVEKYLNDNNLVAIEKGADANVSNLESKLTPPPPADDEKLASILKGLETGELKEEELSEYDKELLTKERQRVLDEQEPTLDLENITPLEEFETKDSLEIYGITFGINLNKTKKLENMYAELLAHIETLKTK
ncbi:MAG: hypothetical protein PHV52_00195 [Aliarcobacter sp.]|nr:hypothetical protein [Aliarcobacter sp.]